MLEAAADTGAEAVAKTARRRVGGRVVGELGRAEEATGERVLLREQEGEPGQHPERKRQPRPALRAQREAQQQQRNRSAHRPGGDQKSQAKPRHERGPTRAAPQREGQRRAAEAA